MKRCTVMLIIVSVMSLILCFARAEGFDATAYSYEELQQIQQKINERLEELDRQYAIENADRQIVFAEDGILLFVKQAIYVSPEVIRKTENAPNQTKLKWTSSNPDIVRVRDNGQLTGYAQGDAVITVTAADNQYITGSFTVHVVIPVEKITIWGQDMPLWLTDNEEEAISTLDWSIEPEDADYQGVTWTSSDETIVTVDENGTIQGLQPGTAVITATSTESQIPDRPQISAACTVTVRQAVKGLELYPDNIDMFTGETKALALAVMPENADDQSVFFRSSNPEVAGVDPDGNVTARECGECDIICEAADGNGASASSHITVTRPVTGLEISETEIRIAAGETYTVEAAVMPEDATNKIGRAHV